MEELWETAYFLFIYVTGTENKSSFKLNCAETLIIAGRCVMAQHSILEKHLMLEISLLCFACVLSPSPYFQKQL